MQVTPANIAALQVGFRKDYSTAYTETPVWWPFIAAQVPSDSAETVQGWLAHNLNMREWVGPRLVQSLYSHSQRIKNRKFELTVSVSIDDLEDDRLGVYSDKFIEMGRATRKWPDTLAREIIQANPICFDGKAMFATDHPLDPNKPAGQANLFNLPLTADNFDTVWSAMCEYTGENGEPLGVMPDLLMVPPRLKRVAREILEADRNAAGATNVQKGDARIEVIKDWANEPTTWRLVDSSKPAKPFFFQLRKEPVLVMKDGPTDDNVFWDQDVVWGAVSRGEIAPGPWWLAAESTPP